MKEHHEVPDAVLIWNGDISGASFALPVESVSDPSVSPGFVRVGIDEDTGLGFLDRANGVRCILTEMDPDLVREALAMDTAVVVEIEVGSGERVEYPVAIEAPGVASAPGL